jgi:hypothetical protein
LEKKTARDTLEASGISLYLFTAASCHKGKWKDAYFDLLRMLKTRRADVDDSLRGNLCLPSPHSNFSHNNLPTYSQNKFTARPLVE